MLHVLRLDGPGPEGGLGGPEADAPNGAGKVAVKVRHRPGGLAPGAVAGGVAFEGGLDLGPAAGEGFCEGLLLTGDRLHLDGVTVCPEGVF